MFTRFLLLLLWVAVGLPFQAVWAQVMAPSMGGGVSLVRVTATTMELSFGAMGTGQGRVVALAAAPGGTPVPLAATDGTFYPADTVYGRGAALGKGYAVYSGTGHSVTVTGLLPSTSYYITNAEYNTDSTSILYNTRGSSVSTTTRAASPSSTTTPLPVELVAFTGTVDAHGLATLRWQTASEYNSAYFAPERSADGTVFAEAGRVAAAGTSAQALAYQWPDPQPLASPTYYRLRQVDRDGAVHYSPVLVLSPPMGLARQVEVYPNPGAAQAVQLLLRGYEREPLMLRLTDALGRLVLAQPLLPTAADYQIPLPLPADLSPGTYLLTLAGTSSPVQKRLIVSN